MRPRHAPMFHEGSPCSLIQCVRIVVAAMHASCYGAATCNAASSVVMASPLRR